MPQQGQAQTLGADLSWVTEMEAKGYTWKDAQGKLGDPFAICKGLGMDGCRLRVWVNPPKGFCGKEDLIAKAKRAKAQGMKLFIDFHFSDSWADPKKQPMPAAWASHDVAQLKKDIYDHVRDVLSALVAADCAPYLVQVGNETNDGLMWPIGKASLHPENYAAFIMSGYEGVKSVIDVPVVVHLSNGWDNKLYRWNFDILEKYHAKYDMIGMSLYPGVNNWAEKVAQCKYNIQDMKSRYGKDCILAEVGLNSDAVAEGAKYMRAARGLTPDMYYWEPESYFFQGYKKGAWDQATSQPTAVLTEGYTGAIIPIEAKPVPERQPASRP